MQGSIRIGVISDTHGTLRPEALCALTGAHSLLHAGDIGSTDVLQDLKRIAPIVAVRGNNDRGDWAARLPARVTFTVDGVGIHLLHDLKELDFDAAGAGVRVVVSGHSHVPSIVTSDGVLYLNPGSAGPRRFKLPVCIAWLEIGGGRFNAEIVELQV